MKAGIAKKMILLFVSAAILLSFLSACTSENSENKRSENTTEENRELIAGLICFGDEESYLDEQFISDFKTECEDRGLIEDETFFIKKNIKDRTHCLDALKELIDSGCSYIFSNSIEHEDAMIETASSYPDISFICASGIRAHTEQIDNYHNAFAQIHDGRYLTGVAAGMMLNEMIKAGEIKKDSAVIGYVGSFTCAEVISGYTAFYLGARSVCPYVEMKVTFTGKWYDEMLEEIAAEKLIFEGCCLLSQHTCSVGVPSVCEKRNIPDISYYGSLTSYCPNTNIMSSYIDWSEYFKISMNSYVKGDPVDKDWIGSLKDGSVKISDINDKVCSEGTVDKIEEVKKELEEGSIHVFDIETFKVNDTVISSYEADIDNDPSNIPDKEVVSDGYFHESEYRSAPYFDLQIDGIELLDTAF